MANNVYTSYLDNEPIEHQSQVLVCVRIRMQVGILTQTKQTPLQSGRIQTTEAISSEDIR